MSTYCRITGKSRGLPKPHYFPLLPPISPADAKRICRITGKSQGLPTHHFIPVLMVSRNRTRARTKTECHITTKSEDQPTHHYVYEAAERHTVVRGYRYLAPHIDQQTHPELVALLQGKSCAAAGQSTDDCEELRKFIYTIDDHRCSVVLPGRLEAAIRDGDVRDLMLSRDNDKILIKLKRGETIELDVREFTVSKQPEQQRAQLYEGEGPSKEALIGQRRSSTKKKKAAAGENNTDWKRKMFEDKERLAMSEEERLSEINSKRIKVKLKAGASKHRPLIGTWRNVRAEAPRPPITKNLNFERILLKTLTRMNGIQRVEQLIKGGAADTRPLTVPNLPNPIRIEALTVDLNESLPGIIQQPITMGEHGITGFPLARIVAPFQPLVAQLDEQLSVAINKLAENERYMETLMRTQAAVQQKHSSMLLPLGQVGAAVQALSKLMEVGAGGAKEAVTALKKSKFQQGVKLAVRDEKTGEQRTYYVPGQFVQTATGEIFVPGNVIEASSGPSFVPGFAVQSAESEVKFLPGMIVKDGAGDNKADVFVAGQTALTRDGEKFVQGQMVATAQGVRFMPGQTIITEEGVRFIPGQVVIDDQGAPTPKFVPGQIIMAANGPQFVPGQFHQDAQTAEITFVAGQSFLNENANWEFVPGQSVKADEGCVFVAGRQIDDGEESRFVPGQIVVDGDGQQHFVPGITTFNTDGDVEFVTGLEIETAEGTKFVEGILSAVAAEDDETDALIFTPGKLTRRKRSAKKSKQIGGFCGAEADDEVIFEPATNADQLCFHNPHSGISVDFDTISSADGAEVFGHLVQSAQGVEFFPGETVTGLPAGLKVIPGRLVRGKEMRFIPGSIQNGVFIPGQFVTSEDNSERFIPGQVIETHEGTKFVPGQVLQTRSGPKFVPGQLMNTDTGEKFIPGQIIETKRGPTFIPGQVIYTEEEGSQFVPGQVVDTTEGARFVPGRVVETGDHVTFIPGQIVETDEGLKFVAPDLEDDPEGGYHFTVQGFEVAPEEIQMIGNAIPHACYIGEMAIDAKMLQQLAQAGMAVGRQLPVDIPGVNIRSLPVTEAACRVAHNLDIDPAQTVQMSHILSNLQQIKQAAISIDPQDLKDSAQLQMLVHIALESGHHKESYEFLQTLGDALEDTIKIDSTEPLQRLTTIDTLHHASNALVARVKERSKVVEKVAQNLASKLELNSTYVRDKVGEILSNLHQMKKAKTTVPRKSIKDKNLKMLVNLISNCDDDNQLTDVELLNVLGNALESTLNVDAAHSLQTIETLSALTAELSSTARKAASPSYGSAVDTAAAMKIDPSNAVKIKHILDNLTHVQAMDIATNGDLSIGQSQDDHLLHILVNLTQQPSTSDENGVDSPSILPASLASVLEDVLALDADPSSINQRLSKLCDSTKGLISDASRKITSINSFVRGVVQKMSLNESQSAKLDKTVKGLLRLKQSTNCHPANNQISQTLMDFVQENKHLSEDEFMTAVQDQVEKLISNAGNDESLVNVCIDNMHTSISNAASRLKAELKNTTETALIISNTLNATPQQALEISNIITNLKAITESGLGSVITNDDPVKCDQLELILGLVSGGADISNAEQNNLIRTLGTALKSTLTMTDDAEQKSVINSLGSITSNMMSKLRGENESLKKAASLIAEKSNLDTGERSRLVTILKNMKKMKAGDVSLASVAINDPIVKETLSKIMNGQLLVDDSGQFVENVTNTLIPILNKMDASKQAEIVDSLDKITTNVMSHIEANLKESTVHAQSMAATSKFTTPELVKVSKIISNIQKIKELNLPIPEKLLSQCDTLNMLMNLAHVSETKDMGDQLSDSIDCIALAFEKTLQLEMTNKEDLINVMSDVTNKILTEAKKESDEVRAIADEIAKKANLQDAEAPVNISKILSNIQQIHFSSTKSPSNNAYLNKVLDFAAKKKNDKKLANSVAIKLEEIIRENGPALVETLLRDSDKMVAEIRQNSKVVAEKAFEVGREFNVNAPQLTRVNNILSNLQQIQKTGLLSPGTADILGGDSANLELLMNLVQSAMSSGTTANNETLQALSKALVDTLNIDSLDSCDVIQQLEKYTNDMVVSTRVCETDIKNRVSKTCQKHSLSCSDDGDSTKLQKILTNIQQLKAHSSNGLLTSTEIENPQLALVFAALNSRTDGVVSPTRGEILETAHSLIENILGESDNPQEKVAILENLVQASSVLCENTNKKLSSTLETAMHVARDQKLDAAQTLKLGRILNNLQCVIDTNFCLDDETMLPPTIAHQKLEIIAQLAAAMPGKLPCNGDQGQQNGIKSLADALTAATDIKSECEDLFESTNTLMMKTRDRVDLFKKKADKLASKFGLNSKSKLDLQSLFINSQNIKSMTVDIQKLSTPNSDLRILMKSILRCNPKKGDVELLSVVGKTIEHILEKCPAHMKNEVVAELSDLMRQIVTQQKEHASDTAEMACIIANESHNLPKKCVAEVHSILKNLQKIQQLGGFLECNQNGRMDDDVQMLMGLSLACVDMDDHHHKLKRTASIIETNLSMKPAELQMETLEKLHQQTLVVLKDICENKFELRRKAEQIAHEMNLNKEQTEDMEIILADLKLLKVNSCLDTMTLHHPNKRIESLLESSFDVDNPLNNSQLLEDLSTFLKNTILPEDIPVLKQFTSKLAQEQRSKTLYSMENAVTIANDFNLGTTESVKISHILSNLETIKRTGLPLSHPAEDTVHSDDLQVLLNLTMDHDENVSQAQLFQKLTSALQKTIHCSSQDTNEKITNLDELLETMTAGIQDKVGQVSALAKHTAHSANLPDFTVPILSQVLIDVQQLLPPGKLDRALLDYVENSSVRKLIIDMLNTECEPQNESFLSGISHILEDKLQQQTEPLDLLNETAKVTRNLVAKKKQQLKYITENAAMIANKLQLKSNKDVVNIANIIANVQTIENSNLSLQRDHDIGPNGPLSLLINLAIAGKFEEQSQAQLQEYTKALETTIKMNNMDSHRSTIAAIMDQSDQWANEAVAHLAVYEENAIHILKSCKLDDCYLAKVRKLLCNLQTMAKKGHFDVRHSRAIDEKSPLNALANYIHQHSKESDNLSIGNLDNLDNLVRDSFEHVLKEDSEHKVQNINSLLALTNRLIKEADEKALLMAQAAHGIVSSVADTDKSAQSCAKINSVLSDLHFLIESDVDLPVEQSTLLQNKHSLDLLLRLSASCRNEENLPEVVDSMAKALKDVLASGSDDFNTVLDELSTTMPLLKPLARQRLRVIQEKSARIVENCRLSMSSAGKVSTLLTNLANLRQSDINVNLLQDEQHFKNEKLRRFCRGVLSSLSKDEECGGNGIDGIATALENLLIQEAAENESDEFVDTLLLVTDDLKVSARDKQSLITEASMIVSKQYGMALPETLKLSNTISKLYAVLQSSMAIPHEQLSDENYRILLDLVANPEQDCCTSKDADTIRHLADILVENINMDVSVKEDLLGKFDGMTATLAEIATVQMNLGYEKAAELANKLNVGEAYISKLYNILTGCLQIKYSTIDVTKYKGTQKWRQLFDSIAELDENGDVDSLIRHLGKVIEETVRSDPEHKLQNINSLYVLLEDIVKADKQKSFLLANSALQLTQDLDASSAQFVDMNNVLHNLYEMSRANINVACAKVTQDDNQEMNILMELALAPQSDGSRDSTLIPMLCKALKGTLQVGGGENGAGNSITTRSLASLTGDLKDQTLQQVRQIEQTAESVVAHLKLSKDYVPKVQNIVADLCFLVRKKSFVECSKNVVLCHKNVRRILAECCADELLITSNGPSVEAIADIIKGVLADCPKWEQGSVIDGAEHLLQEMTHREKEKMYIVSKNAVELACELKLGVEEVVKTKGILDDLENVGEADVLSAIKNVDDCDLNLLLTLAAQNARQSRGTRHEDNVNALQKALKNMVQMNADSGGSATIENLRNLSCRASQFLEENERIVALKAENIMGQLKMDGSHLPKVASILSNLQSMGSSIGALNLQGLSVECTKLVEETVKAVENSAAGSEAEFLEKLTTAVKDLIGKDCSNEVEMVDRLDRLFDVSASLVHECVEEKSTATTLAYNIGRDLGLSSDQVIKMGDAISNLKYISVENAPMDVARIDDQNARLLIDFALSLNGDEAENKGDIFNVLSVAVKKTLNLEPENIAKSIDILSGASRAAKDRINETVSCIRDLSTKLGEDLSMDAKHSGKVNATLEAILRVRHAAAGGQKSAPFRTLAKENADCKQMQILMSVVEEIGDDVEDARFLEIVSDAIHNILLADLEQKNQSIDALHAKIHDQKAASKGLMSQSAKMSRSSCDIAKRLGISASSAVTINSVLCALKQAKKLQGFVSLNHDIQDQDLKLLFQQMACCHDDVDGDEFLLALCNAVENTVDVDESAGPFEYEERIDQLQALAKNLASLAHQKSAKVGAIAEQISRKHKLDDVEGVERLMCNLLQLRGQIGCKSVVDDVPDKAVQKLMRFVASEGGADKAAKKNGRRAEEDAGDFIRTVGELLEAVFSSTEKSDSSISKEGRRQTLKKLRASTNALLAEAQERDTLVAEVAKTIACEMDTEASAIHIGHVLDNLRRIKLSNEAGASLFSSDELTAAAKDEEDDDLNLKSLINLALIYEGDVQSADFLQTLGHALHASSRMRQSTNDHRRLDASQMLQKYHSLTRSVVENIERSGQMLEATASKTASTLKLDQSLVRNILADFKQVQSEKASILGAAQNVQDDNVRLILEAVSECASNKMEESEFLDSVAAKMVNIIEMDLEHRTQTINALGMCTRDIAQKSRDRGLLGATMACKVADKLNMDVSQSMYIEKLLSDLQQIRQIGVVSSSDGVSDRNLEALLKRAFSSERDNGCGGANDTSTDRDDEDRAFLVDMSNTLQNILLAEPKNKLALLGSLQTMTRQFLTDIQQHPTNKVQLLKNLVRNNLQLNDEVVDKLSSILDEHEMQMCIAFQHMSRENPDFVNKVLQNAASILTDRSVDERKAVGALHRAIVKAVGETSEQKVTQAMAEQVAHAEQGQLGHGEHFKNLVVDALSLAKALGLNEVVRMLSDILKDTRSLPLLAKDKIVMEVLKRLTVMRQLAEKRPSFRGALLDLQYDPYAARNDPRLRELVRESAVLMVIPEESMVLRSSADIPSSLLLGDNTLAVEDFMVKSRQQGRTFLILKRGLQMVIPKEAAKDVLTGKVPYTVLDENGIHHFTPLHVFNALKLPKVAANRFSNYGYSPKLPPPAKHKKNGANASSDDDHHVQILSSRCSSVAPSTNGASSAAGAAPPTTASLHNGLSSLNNIPNGHCSTQEAILRRSSTPLRGRIYGDSSSSYKC